MFAIVTVLAAALVDLFRSRRSLLTEIALLRHQLTVLRATGVLLPKSATGGFLEKVASSATDEELRALIDPLVRTLEVLDAEIVKVEARLAQLAEQDPTIALCATAPGVGLIVAATYVSVIDDAKRFPQATGTESPRVPKLARTTL
jgi:transposase